MKKSLIIGLVVVLLLAILVGVFYSKDKTKNIKIIEKPNLTTLNELSSLCNYQDTSSCEGSTCEGMKFNISAYISQAQVEANLIPLEGTSYQTNYYNSSEYEIGLMFQDSYPNSVRSMKFILDDSLVLTKGEPDQEKINEVVSFFDNLLENSYYKNRKVSFETEIEKRDCYTSDGQCLSCDRRLIKDLDGFKLLPEGDVIFPKETLFESVEHCNQVFKETGGDDTCFGYHYYHRGCYYETSGLKQCPGYGGGIKPLFELYNLDYDESKEFCMKFEHGGLAANCLKNIGSDNQECLNFAKDDEYLLAICNLEEGNINFTARGVNEF